MEYEARLGTPQGEQPVKRPNLQCRPQASEREQVVEGILQMLGLRIPGRPLLQQVDVFDLGPRQFAQPPGFGGGIAGQMSLPKMTEDISIVEVLCVGVLLSKLVDLYLAQIYHDQRCRFQGGGQFTIHVEINDPPLIIRV